MSWEEEEMHILVGEDEVTRVEEVPLGEKL